MSFQNTCPWSQRHCNSIQNVLVPDHNEIVCDFKTHVYLITTALYFISKHMSLITTTLYFNPKRTCPWSQRHCMWFQDARVPDHNNIVFPFTKYLSLITTTLYVISRRTCLLSQEAESNGTRTVLLRIGIVLANDGGALGKVRVYLCVRGFAHESVCTCVCVCQYVPTNKM